MINMRDQPPLDESGSRCLNAAGQRGLRQRKHTMPCALRLALAVLLTSLSLPVFAAGLDRDTLLTEAPAVPNAGTVRVSGGANGQPSGAADSGSTGGVSANLMWATLECVAV